MLKRITSKDVYTENKKFTYDDVVSEEGLILIAAWTRDGMTQQDIMKRLGISQEGWYRWRRKSEQVDGDPIGTALRRGKEIIDYQVENALLKAALGYKTKTIKTTIGPPDKNGNREIKMEKTITEVGPNTTACLAWLNNRKPESWKRNRDNVLEYDDKKSGITINIVKGGATIVDNEDDDDWDEE